MSQANSLARKRRAGITQEPPPPSFPNSNPQQNANMKQVGLTLPQVVAVIDSRLILLETFMKETKSNVGMSPSVSSVQPATMPVISEEDAEITNEFISEVNHRFEFLMSELVDLKDIVMKLQSYTMDVNKTLLEERIHLLSDIGSSSPVPYSVPYSVPEPVNSGMTVGSPVASAMNTDELTVSEEAV